ncbi:MAG: hypothetical protein ACLFS2_02455 [Halochromatium sp.]|uniref:hypothetical protein n=1 Tax=Halochromatium sp. TaxID=2049430 RepID=UPI00397D6453
MADAVDLEQVGSSWLEVAARLAAALRASPGDEAASATLRQTVRMLGGVGYPGFLKILKLIAESDDTAAKRDVAHAVGVCLQRADPPAGELTSWGASSLWPEDETIPADELAFRASGVAPRRSLGPIEYLTVWYCQRTQRPLLSERVYGDTVGRIIALLNHDATARQVYPVRLESELATGPEGAYTRRTRLCLTRIAEGWKAGDEPSAIVSDALRSIADGVDERDRWLGDT